MYLDTRVVLISHGSIHVYMLDTGTLYTRVCEQHEHTCTRVF